MSRREDPEIEALRKQAVIGVWWGIISWVILFSTLLCVIPDLDPPTPREGESSQSIQNRSDQPKEEPAILKSGAETSAFKAKLAGADAQKDSAANYQKQTGRESFKQRWAKVDWRVAFLTGWLVIVGAFQAGLFVWQLSVIQKSLRDTRIGARAALKSAVIADRSVRFAEINSERQLRAYVSIELPAAPNFIQHEVFKYNILLRNHGPTPAKHLAFRANLQHGPTPLPPELAPIAGDWNEERGNLFPIGDSITKFLLNCQTGYVFSADEMNQFYAGTRVLRMGIEISYKDIFEQTRYTQEYFLVYVPNPHAIQTEVSIEIVTGGSRLT